MEMVETGSDQSERTDYTAIDIENSFSQLATSVRSELDNLRPLEEKCIIHRVPKSLRQLDEKVYSPRIVSIGPIHHGREDLKEMEQYKRRYLQNFLQRTEVSLEYFIKVIKDKEEKLRNCCAETIDLDSDKFVKMVLVDAAFIIEVLLISHTQKWIKYDRIFDSPENIYDVEDDMFMLENQLPFFILEDLFTQANINISSENNERVSLLQIIHEFTEVSFPYLIIGNLEERDCSSVKHLLDFLRICLVPSKLQDDTRTEIQMVPSITELHQAGVRFNLGSTKNMFEISFKNGILEIPQIRVPPPLELILKNLLVLERCQTEVNFLGDYIIFLNNLVRTPKDVELLVEHKIIWNPLGDGKRVTTILQNLVEPTTYNLRDFYFSSHVEDLNRYCRRRRHRWKATLKQEHFKTPWTIISIIAAIVLLILTFIQAISSLRPVK